MNITQKKQTHRYRKRTNWWLPEAERGTIGRVVLSRFILKDWKKKFQWLSVEEKLWIMLLSSFLVIPKFCKIIMLNPLNLMLLRKLFQFFPKTAKETRSDMKDQNGRLEKHSTIQQLQETPFIYLKPSAMFGGAIMPVKHILWSFAVSVYLSLSLSHNIRNTRLPLQHHRRVLS